MPRRRVPKAGPSPGDSHLRHAGRLHRTGEPHPDDRLHQPLGDLDPLRPVGAGHHQRDVVQQRLPQRPLTHRPAGDPSRSAVRNVPAAAAASRRTCSTGMLSTACAAAGGNGQRHCSSRRAGSSAPPAASTASSCAAATVTSPGPAPATVRVTSTPHGSRAASVVRAPSGSDRSRTGAAGSSRVSRARKAPASPMPVSPCPAPDSSPAPAPRHAWAPEISCGGAYGVMNCHSAPSAAGATGCAGRRGPAPNGPGSPARHRCTAHRRG